MSMHLTKEPRHWSHSPKNLNLGAGTAENPVCSSPNCLRTAFGQSLIMLRPDIQWKNPVMFMVEVGTV